VIRLSALIGQPVVSLRDAEQVGHVDAVGLRAGRIVSIGAGRLVVPAEAIRTFEGDAVTFDPFPALEDHTSRPVADVIGRRVLDRHGDELGPLVDLDIDGDGTIVLVELPDRTMPGARLHVVGTYAAVVDSEPAELPPPAPPPSAPPPS